jgi:penicillin-binding protein 1A
VPIFTDFMTRALRERPARPFVRPRNAVFRTVNGIEEAFRPGTERATTRRRSERAVGPLNYNDVIRQEQGPGRSHHPEPAAALGPAAAAEAARKDLSGLY